MNHVNNLVVHTNPEVNLNRRKPRIIRVVTLVDQPIQSQELGNLFPTEKKVEEPIVQSEVKVEEPIVQSGIKVELSEAEKYINNLNDYKKNMPELKDINFECKAICGYVQQLTNLDMKELSILLGLIDEIWGKIPQDISNKVPFLGKARKLVLQKLEQGKKNNPEIKSLVPEKKKKTTVLPTLELNENNQCKQQKLQVIQKALEENKASEVNKNKIKEEKEYKTLKTLEAIIDKPSQASFDIKVSEKIIKDNKLKICQWLNLDDAKYEEITPKLIELHRLLASCLDEINTIENSNINEVPMRALNAILLFTSQTKLKDGSVEDICKDTLLNLKEFIKKKAANYVHPVHDIFMYNLPLIDNREELLVWKSLIVGGIGIFALSVIDFAGAILKAGSSVKNIKNKAELTQLLKNFKYSMVKSASKGLQKIAGFCSENQVSENQFNKMIALDAKLKFKTQELIPNITVYDEENGLVWMKLDASSKLPYMLGNVVKCCQHVNGHSEKCVIDGMTRENNGFYVMLKLDSTMLEQFKEARFNQLDIDQLVETKSVTIIGIAYAWNSQSGNLVVDSLEFHGNYKNENNIQNIVGVIQTFSDTVLENSDYNCVLVGCGGGTQGIIKIDYKNTYKDRMIEGYLYGDARTQHLLSKSKKLQAAIKANKAPEQISSMQQLKQYLAINQYINEHLEKGYDSTAKSRAINRFILEDAPGVYISLDTYITLLNDPKNKMDEILYLLNKHVLKQNIYNLDILVKKLIQSTPEQAKLLVECIGEINNGIDEVADPEDEEDHNELGAGNEVDDDVLDAISDIKVLDKLVQTLMEQSSVDKLEIIKPYLNGITNADVIIALLSEDVKLENLKEVMPYLKYITNVEMLNSLNLSKNEKISAFEVKNMILNYINPNFDHKLKESLLESPDYIFGDFVEFVKNKPASITFDNNMLENIFILSSYEKFLEKIADILIIQDIETRDSILKLIFAQNLDTQFAILLHFDKVMGFKESVKALSDILTLGADDAAFVFECLKELNSKEDFMLELANNNQTLSIKQLVVKHLKSDMSKTKELNALDIKLAAICNYNKALFESLKGVLYYADESIKNSIEKGEVNNIDQLELLYMSSKDYQNSYYGRSMLWLGDHAWDGRLQTTLYCLKHDVMIFGGIISGNEYWWDDTQYQKSGHMLLNKLANYYSDTYKYTSVYQFIISDFGKMYFKDVKLSHGFIKSDDLLGAVKYAVSLDDKLKNAFDEEDITDIKTQYKILQKLKFDKQEIDKFINEKHNRKKIYI